MKLTNIPRLIAIIIVCSLLSACVGKLVGAVVDTTIEVAKVPFKVGGAVIDVVTPDKKKSDKDNSKKNDEDEDE